MLAELETRLAQVLGTRLDAPFTGRVVRRSAPAPGGSGPVIRVGVETATPVDPALQTIRPEVVPGSPQLRRVVRLRTTIGFTVEPSGQGGAGERVLGTDALLYALDDPAIRSAEALSAPGDPGFLIESLVLAAAAPARAASEGATVTVEAEGLFWPVGVTGQDGRAIERSLVREFLLPVRLDLDAPLLAGGPVVRARVAVGLTGMLVVQEDEVATEPFGRLAVRIIGPDGGAPAGELAGGAAGPDGSRVVLVEGDGVTVRYTPPATPATDLLLVSAHTRDDSGEDRIGVELARFDLVVTS